VGRKQGCGASTADVLKGEILDPIREREKKLEKKKEKSRIGGGRSQQNKTKRAGHFKTRWPENGGKMTAQEKL